jgi:hypothetical protein
MRVIKRPGKNCRTKLSYMKLTNIFFPSTLFLSEPLLKRHGRSGSINQNQL